MKKNKIDSFYLKVITDLLASGSINQKDSILVVCGGDKDFLLFDHLKFSNVTISNIDDHSNNKNDGASKTYKLKHLDLQNLDLPDSSYDYVVVHSGLHHLKCPPLGLTEMFRVSKKGVIGFEPNKNLFTMLGVKMGFGQEYETASVYKNDCKCGGVNDSEIPNYVYRFHKDDIVRAIQSYSPIYRYTYMFWYTTRLPGRLSYFKNPLIRYSAACLRHLFILFGRFTNIFANNMAFAVLKPDNFHQLLPWIKLEDGEFRVNEHALKQLYEKNG